MSEFDIVFNAVKEAFTGSYDALSRIYFGPANLAQWIIAFMCFAAIMTLIRKVTGAPALKGSGSGSVIGSHYGSSEVMHTKRRK